MLSAKVDAILQGIGQAVDCVIVYVKIILVKLGKEREIAQGGMAVI